MNWLPGLNIIFFLKRYRLLLLCTIFLWITPSASAQNNNTTDTNKVETINATADSIAVSPADSTQKTDTASIESKEKKLGIRISKDGLPSVVTTKAKDSAVLNIKEKVFYLYGDAQANYDDLQIKSGQLVYHQQSSMLMALPTL